MKKTIVVFVVLMLCGICLANDPNSMPKPTSQNPVTMCETVNPDGSGEVTIKMYFDSNGMEAIAFDNSFEKLVRGWQNQVAIYVAKIYVAKIRLDLMIRLHVTDSLTFLKDQVAAKEKETK